MHAKYEASTNVSLMVQKLFIANVKVDNRQTNKQTGQKQYAPDLSIRGHKKKMYNFYKFLQLFHRRARLTRMRSSKASPPFSWRSRMKCPTFSYASWEICRHWARPRYGYVTWRSWVVSRGDGCRTSYPVYWDLAICQRIPLWRIVHQTPMT